MKLSRVTQSGKAANVAISPDGHYVVYALREGEKQSLNVRQVATGRDGRQLALTRGSESSDVILINSFR
jgi:Tol biopolymer transport system component